MTTPDRLWQLVLDCLDAEEPPFSKGTLIGFRTRLIESQMDRRLIERTIEVAKYNHRTSVALNSDTRAEAVQVMIRHPSEVI